MAVSVVKLKLYFESNKIKNGCFHPQFLQSEVS